MTDKLYFAVVRQQKMIGRRRRLIMIKKEGPMEIGKARTRCAALRREWSGLKGRYEIKVEGDRAAYWHARHNDKFQNEPTYRERRKKQSSEWQRNARAEARGELPWLSTSQK